MKCEMPKQRRRKQFCIGQAINIIAQTDMNFELNHRLWCHQILNSASFCRPINVSPHSPPPGGVGLTWGIWPYLRSNSPWWGKDSVFKSPSQQGVFEPQAVAHIKTGYKSSLYYAKPGQIPQYGAKISGQIRSNSPVCPGGGSGATHW